MIRHLLVPLDGSPLAEAALPAAALLAERLRAKVTLLHAIERNPPSEVHGQPHLRSEAEAETYLQAAARNFPPGVTVERHVHAAEVDNVAGSIVDHAKELGQDLIVMCSHGRGKALHLLLGSIAQKITSLGLCPVLLTRPDAKGGPAPFSCDPMLLPLDDDPDHAQAIPVALDLAAACSSRLLLATVVPGFHDLAGQRAVTSRFLPGTMSRLLDLSVTQAQERLGIQVQALAESGVQAAGRILRGDPAKAIVDLAAEFAAGVIVMATHGSTGLAALLEGRVAHKVCSLTNTPLLLVPVRRA
jgi:nucleotide-binding universal stress UspA family protein